MSVLISFLYEKDGEQIETVHSTITNDFTRDDLVDKFNNFLKSLGYVFPEECHVVTGTDPANFELE